MDVILASESPRRRELLKRLIQEFQVVPSGVDERLFDRADPLKFAVAAAKAKARDVGERHPDALIIAADTIVCLEDEIFGKPADRAEAEAILARLSGRVHRVITGVALYKKDEERLVTGFEITRVAFRELGPEAIAAYLDHHEFRDKAGSYAIQEAGEAFIEKIEGDYDNVVGFPVRRVARMLAEFRAPEFVLEVDDFDPKTGWPTGRPEGRAAFIPGASVGDRVRARLAGKKPRVLKVLETLGPSPWRVAAPCPHFGTCGGCAFQNLDYKKQVELKEAHLRGTLAGAGIAPAAVLAEPMLPSPGVFGYRNKMEYAFAGRAGNIYLGLRERAWPGSRGRKRTAALGECPIFNPAVPKIFRLVLEDVKTTGLPAYHPISQEGFFRNLVLREAKATGEIMALLVTKSGPLPEAPSWAERWIREEPTIKSVWRVENDRTADVVDFERAHHLAGEPWIEEKLGGLSFRIHPESFFQPNPEGAALFFERLAAQALEWGSRRALGLFCGAGAIELYLARNVERVWGIDAASANIRNAEENARLNGISNVRFAEAWVERSLGDEGRRDFDLLVLDPPREGLRPVALQRVAGLRIPRLIYMSCNVRTFVQDATALAAAGYRLFRLAAADFFPHTPHFEVLGFFSR
jgi:23S rRNA (uracil1939-C5)-methyltransferase